MKIVIARVAKGRSSWGNQASEEYLRRVGRPWAVEEKTFIAPSVPNFI